MKCVPEKLCVFCENWSFSGGSPGYSEMTPGSDASMNCEKGHWKQKGRRSSWFDLTNVYGPDDFRALILKAETCPDYKPVSLPQGSSS